MDNAQFKGKWPNGAHAAISLTIDNMGEAADLNRKLWSESEPLGKHYSVTKIIPQFLGLLKKYNILATYFIESWNTNVYSRTILDDIIGAGHEMGWHAWQHESWAKLSEAEEEANFARSFGVDGIGKWLDTDLVKPYSGFRPPPGGIINGERTLSLCYKYGLKYLSPAGEEPASVTVGSDDGTLVILPFRWAAVDAYYYMETFAGLRKMKGEYPTEPQSTEVLVKRFISEIDGAIATGSFRALLFHPFLTNSPERIEAFETVLQYMAKKRDEGLIWLERCKEVAEVVAQHPNLVGTDPHWDLSSWR